MNQFIKASTYWLSFRLILGVLVSVFAVTAHAALYRTSADGSVVWDESTGLVWMRCALGQTWDGKTCEGTAAVYKFTALEKKVTEFNAQNGFAGFKDWKVPTDSEIFGLRLCTSGVTVFNMGDYDGKHIKSFHCKFNSIYPAIDSNIFPNTLKGAFWSTTPANAKHYPNHYLSCINFYAADSGAYVCSSRLEKESNPVRLVRDIQLSTDDAALTFPIRLTGTNQADVDRAEQVIKAEEDRKSKELYEKERRAQAVRDEKLRREEEQWRREAPAREAREREENRRREAYERTPAGRAEAQQRQQQQQQQQGRQLCQAQVNTCVASCPRWVNQAGYLTSIPEYGCQSRCESVSCN